MVIFQFLVFFLGLISFFLFSLEPKIFEMRRYVSQYISELHFRKLHAHHLNSREAMALNKRSICHQIKIPATGTLTMFGGRGGSGRNMLMASINFDLILLFASLMIVSVGSFRMVSPWGPSISITQVRKGNAATKLLMSSVSTGGTASRPSQPPRSAGFIISPSSVGSENELLILQNFNQIQYGEKLKFGVIGTQDLSNNHKQMVELLSYALILSGNHVYTSAGSINGTNLAVIQGSLRACNPDLLTVILPQSLFRQPPEIHSLLLRVANLIQQPQYDDLDLKEAAAICNEQILSNVQKLLVFCYHDSTTILNPIEAVKDRIEIITFYLD